MPETPEQELERLRNAVRDLLGILRLEDFLESLSDLLMNEHGSQCDCAVCRTWGYAAELYQQDEE